MPKEHKVIELLVIQGSETVFQGLSRHIPAVLLDLAAQGIKENLSVYVRSPAGWHEHHVPTNFIQALHGLKNFDVADYPKPVFGTPIPKPNGRRVSITGDTTSPVALVADLLDIAGHAGKIANDFLHYKKTLEHLFQGTDWQEFVRRGNSRKYREDREKKKKDKELQKEVAIAEFLNKDNNPTLQYDTMGQIPQTTNPDKGPATEDAVAALLATLPSPNQPPTPQEPTKTPPQATQTKTPAQPPDDTPNSLPWVNHGTEDFLIDEIDEEELNRRKALEDQKTKEVKAIYHLWLSRRIAAGRADKDTLNPDFQFFEEIQEGTPPSERWFRKNEGSANLHLKHGTYFPAFIQFRRHYEIDPQTWEERLAYSDEDRWIKGQEAEVAQQEQASRASFAREAFESRRAEREAREERIRLNKLEEE